MEWMLVLLSYYGTTTTYGFPSQAACLESIRALVGGAQGYAFCAPRGEAVVTECPPSYGAELHAAQESWSREESCRKRGDLDCDGQTNATDFELFRQEFQQ